ncbi:MAG: HAD-IA family hydrolase [Candidatus Woesearchaeota archaeon]
MSVDYLIFDHSGTISNDFSVVFSSANNILRIFGKPQITIAQYRADFGNDLASVYKKWGVDATIDELDKIHERFLKSQPRPEPVPFAVETIKIASRHVKKVASFSAHPTEELKQDLRNWGIYGYFDAVYGNARKQSNDGFEKILKDLGATKETTLYVGDTTIDIDMAKRNGVRCAAVVNPKYCYQEPQKVRSHIPPADFYLKDISELVPLLKKM